MNKRELLKRNSNLYEEKWKLEAELLEKEDEIVKLTSELRKIQRIAKGFEISNEANWEEICKLKDKIYNLQADKDKCIEFIKKQRCILSHSEDEIARLNDENSKLMENMQALGVTFQENDTAYYKLVEANAFLAGKVQAYESMSNAESDAAETAQ